MVDSGLGEFREDVVNFFKPAHPSPRQRERLEKLRAKGRKHFIVYRGMLRWGLLTFVVFTVLEWLLDFGWHVPAKGGLYRELAFLPFSLIVWLVGGYSLGAAMWARFGFDRIPKNDTKT